MTYVMGEQRPQRVAAKRPDEEELARRGAARPLAKYVRFETENGLALLYEPGH